MRPWVILAVTVVTALLARVLIQAGLNQVAAFYVGLPMIASTALFWTDTPKRRVVWRGHVGEATLVLCFTALVLFEGFLCFIFAAPIYYLAVGIAFYINRQIFKLKTRKGNKAMAATLPVLALILSAEGLTAATTLDRQNETTYRAVTHQTIAQLKTNMAQPIRFDQPRHWFLTVFPLPIKVSAGSLKPGDVHVLDFVYKRWFFTNIHKGALTLRIDAVGHDHVETTIVGNTSYLSGYMTIQGTRVEFIELEDGGTEVSLKLRYERKLDPVWYFAPLQRYAMNKAAQYLTDTVILREQTHG